VSCFLLHAFSAVEERGLRETCGKKNGRESAARRSMAEVAFWEMAPERASSAIQSRKQWADFGVSL
jgi:hypothetical protein